MAKKYSRQPWGLIPLRHVTKYDYCKTDQQRRQANEIVAKWRQENPSASIEEQINFASVLLLWLNFSACANSNLLMDGTRRDDGHVDHDDFNARKEQERKQLPALHKQLSDALSKSGRTGAQKKISEDIRTSAEAATAVYEKHRQVDGDHIETN